MAAGALERIVVLGGGQLTPAVAEFGVNNEIEVQVFVGPRQADTVLLDGTRLSERLESMGASFHVVESIRGIVDNGPYQLGGNGALAFSTGSPFIISQELIDTYGGRVINSHGAPLPQWRGGGGFSWRILAGDRRGHSCFHMVTPGIDEGDIIYQGAYEFPDSARYPRDYMAFATEHATACIADLMAGILEGREFEFEVQDPAQATYFPRLHTASQAHIDWSWPGDAIERFVLAFSYPYDGAMTEIGGGPARIFDCRFESGTAHDHMFFSGIVYRVHDETYHVACSGGSLMIEAQHLKHDDEISVGDRFVTPSHQLEAAIGSRVIYTARGLKQ